MKLYSQVGKVDQCLTYKILLSISIIFVLGNCILIIYVFYLEAEGCRYVTRLFGIKIYNIILI